MIQWNDLEDLDIQIRDYHFGQSKTDGDFLYVYHVVLCKGKHPLSESKSLKLFYFDIYVYILYSNIPTPFLTATLS